jgi:hypothetical protein
LPTNPLIKMNNVSETQGEVERRVSFHRDLLVSVLLWDGTQVKRDARLVLRVN